MTSLRFLSLRSFWPPTVSTDDDDDNGGDGGGGDGDDVDRLASARTACFGVEGIDEDAPTRSRLARHLHCHHQHHLVGLVEVAMTMMMMVAAVMVMVMIAWPLHKISVVQLVKRPHRLQHFTRHR